MALERKVIMAVPATVALIDDHPVIGMMLGEFLGRSGDYRVVGVATEGTAGLELVRRERPDLVVLDLNLAGMGGLEILQVLRDEVSATRVLVFSALATAEAVGVAIALGARGFLHKSTAMAQLVEGLAQVRAGQVVLSGREAELLREGVVGGRAAAELTREELRALRRFALGATMAEIAAELGVSVSSAYRCIERLRAKLQADSAQALTLAAVRLGLVVV